MENRAVKYTSYIYKQQLLKQIIDIQHYSLY